MILRLVSINIWDVPLMPRTQRRRRLRLLRETLPRLGADVVLIQEAFRPRMRHAIVRAMSGFHADGRAARWRWLGVLPMDGSGGLLTLSRWPIASTSYRPARCFRGMKPDERIGRKGCLWTRLATPAGQLLVGNMHLYAGNTPTAAHVRAIQARDLLLHGESTSSIPTILAGDCNWDLEFEHSERGPTGQEIMRAAGFREVADDRSDGLETMDARRNPYARYVPWHRPPRRLSHVFLRGPGLDRGPERPRLCLDDPPVSDHFGLRVSVTVGAVS